MEGRVGIEVQPLASPFPPHSPPPTMVSGSDSSSEGLRYSLCFLFFMGLRSSEVRVQEFWPEAFSTMTDLSGRGQPEGKNHPPSHPAPLLSQEQEWGFGTQKQSK